MIPPTVALTVLSLVLFSIPGKAQEAVSDAQGVEVLTQSLAIVDAANILSTIQDFTATGTITYYWAGEAVQGSATVYGRGASQFRLDADLPEGPRSFVVSRGRGYLREPDGRISRIPFHNTVNLEIPTFPLVHIAAGMKDPLRVTSYLGQEEIDGRPVHVVRVQRFFPQEVDPTGSLANLCVTTYFIDVQTNLLLKSLAMTHPDDNLEENLTHEFEFGNYVNQGGVMVPLIIREKVAGQLIWDLQLNSFSFNSGLSEIDFQLE